MIALEEKTLLVGLIEGQLEHSDLPENYNPRKNIEFWNCSSFLFTVSCNPLCSTGNRFYSTSNRLITRRDRNWWQASPLDEIGQRVWISTPNAIRPTSPINSMWITRVIN